MTEPRPVTLSSAIMAHPRRAELVEDLLRRLDRPVPVVWDKINDRHDTGIRALMAADRTASHHLVIQDDALPCRDLLASIERALVHVPDGHHASFYVGRVRPFRSRIEQMVRVAGGASWLRFPGPYWGPAIVVPTAALDDLAAWWYSPKGQGVTNYDRRIARFFQRQGMDCWYSWPSLVDHRGDESLVTGHTTGRHAHRSVPHDRSGLEVDWSGPVLELREAERLDAQRQREALRARRNDRRSVRG